MTPSDAISRSKARLLKPARGRYANAALFAAGALAASALVNHLLARRAEQANPPKGDFLDVGGVRLHYVERGDGEPLVLLHGNGSMIQDFESSGLLETAAKSYRVIAFDRPGFGYSERPRGTIWTADAQADLIHEAMIELGVKRAIVLGHSWAASVAVALARRHRESVAGLVLASGYYYPSFRSDVVTASGPAVPILGDVLRYTLSPWLARAMWPAMLRKLFGPSPTPAKFDGFPVALTFRPSALRASAADAALMIPNALAAHNHYAEITTPVAIIAGEADRIVDAERQSARLHDELPQSTFDRVEGVGHMVHQSAPERRDGGDRLGVGHALASDPGGGRQEPAGRSGSLTRRRRRFACRGTVIPRRYCCRQRQQRGVEAWRSIGEAFCGRARAPWAQACSAEL